ncbi:hypothetical protein YC2023_002328 [Brassica napus]
MERSKRVVHHNASTNKKSDQKIMSFSGLSSVSSSIRRSKKTTAQDTYTSFFFHFPSYSIAIRKYPRPVDLGKFSLEATKKNN